jgi:predicted acylesterase/phospholipase RssA
LSTESKVLQKLSENLEGISLRGVRPLLPFALAGLIFATAGCAGLNQTPINTPAASPSSVPAEFLAVDDFPDVAIGLAFSGGGTRAAAFSFGVLQELDQVPVPGDHRRRTLLDAVDLVSGVSGGSVIAAYFGLKHRDALIDFRKRFLLQNAEASFSTAISLPNILTVVEKGGANSSRPLGSWLDRNLFEGARFADFRRKRNHPTVWISASDIYNRVPFLFSRETFAALCSDLDRLPVAQAVAASAAFPVAFAPVNLETYNRRCDSPLPPWVASAARDASGSSVRHAVAKGLLRYRDPAQMRYVKLADGGVTDNFGLQVIALARSVGATPYAPLTPEIAVQLRRALFLVVNSGRGPAGDWPLRESGPDGLTTISALADTATEAASRAGYDYFRLLIADWRNKLVRWRCSLPTREVARLRGRAGAWHCADLQMFVGELSFADAGADRARVLDTIPTRFSLPAESVDFTIESGRIAVRNENSIRRFLDSLRSSRERQESRRH